MNDLKVLVKENCTLLFIQNGDAHYQTESGFKFVIPKEDMSNAVFNATEKGMTLMRWIRKAIALIDEARSESASDVG